MTDRWLSFEPVLHPLWLASALIGVAAFFLFLEWKRTARFRGLRMVLITVAMLAISALLFRPQIISEKSDSIILLTKNYDKKKTDSLIAVYSTSRLYAMPGVAPYRGSESLESIFDIEDISSNIDYVTGDGFSDAVYDLIPDAQFQYVPSAFSEGVIDIRLPHEMTVNTSVTISGSVNFSTEKKKIVLQGPGGKEDSVIIEKKGIQPFTLAFTPKQAGKFLYALVVDGKHEKLPVTVTEQAPSSILFLQQYPTFETRYLKQMLGEKHNLLFRYELSKNIFRFEKINYSGKEFQRVSESVLSTFDLLILDTDAFHQLSSNEVKAITSAVKNGLGVIVLFNETPTKGVQSFLPFNVRPYKSDTAHFQVSGKKIALPSWPLEVGADVTPSLKNKNRILSGYANEGFGKIGFQLLQETYRLSLEGDSLSYVKLWSDLLEKVVRSKQEPVSVHIRNSFPFYADEPVSIEVIASNGAPKLMLDSVWIPMAEDPIIDGLWKTKAWFSKPGWQHVQLEGSDSEIPVYVSPDTEWIALSSANAIRQTQQLSTTGKKPGPTQPYSTPVNPIVFYLLFLICFGTLWLLPKV